MDLTPMQQLVSDYEDAVAAYGRAHGRRWGRHKACPELFSEVLRLRRLIFEALDIDEPEISRRQRHRV